MVKWTAAAVVLALAVISGPWIRSNIRETHLKRRQAAFGQRLGTFQKERTEARESAKVSLEQRFGRAMFSSCDLNVHVAERRGHTTLRCVRNIIPPRAEWAADRPLTSREAERLLGLIKGSEILPGPGTGQDTTAADGMKETLIIQRGAERTVFVASGNPTFDAGARRQLLNLLHSILNDLWRRAAGSEP